MTLEEFEELQQRQLGVPKTEEQRIQTHTAVYGDPNVPQRQRKWSLRNVINRFSQNRGPPIRGPQDGRFKPRLTPEQVRQNIINTNILSGENNQGARGVMNKTRISLMGSDRQNQFRFNQQRLEEQFLERQQREQQQIENFQTQTQQQPRQQPRQQRFQPRNSILKVQRNPNTKSGIIGF